MPGLSFKLALEAAYHGTGFGGWQRQSPEAECKTPSIQATLESAAAATLARPELYTHLPAGVATIDQVDLSIDQLAVVAHGRTDRGVHALAHPFFLQWRVVGVSRGAETGPADHNTPGAGASAGLAVAASTASTDVDGNIGHVDRPRRHEIGIGATKSAPPGPTAPRAPSRFSSDAKAPTASVVAAAINGRLAAMGLGAAVMVADRRPARGRGPGPAVAVSAPRCICGKMYTYLVHYARRPAPELRQRCWFVPTSCSLRLGAMLEAAEALEGRHDFANFAAKPPATPGGAPTSTTRTVHRIRLKVHLAEDVTAAGFVLGRPPAQLFADAAHEHHDPAAAAGLEAGPGSGSGSGWAETDATAPSPGPTALSTSGRGVGADPLCPADATLGVVLAIQITADGFLKRMARVIARAIVVAGEGRAATGELCSLLGPPDAVCSSAWDGCRFAPAPAGGLWMCGTLYKESGERLGARAQTRSSQYAETGFII